MKESKFVEQNKKNWLEFETDLRSGNNKTKHSQLFIQVTDDLSYARTFYKFRSVKVYLNGIAQLLFNNLYQNQSTSTSGFVNFWKHDLPYQIHEARKEFRISFLIFLVAMGIGILSSIYDKDFARLILGNDYVQMTVENIKHNDPLAVYKKANEIEMFMGITINNLIVAVYTFLLGAFMSVGTVLALLKNGIMVGVFQYFFIERGLFKESFLTIWQHGTIEISCIIIAGAAGLTLGKGLIFPGTYSRMNSFKISALRGLKIFLGISPLIILAGFIESFITRHTGINDGIRISVIMLSLAFILFYFVWYPWFLNKRNPISQKSTEKLSYQEPSNYDFNKVLTAEELLGNSFKYLSQNILSVFLLIAGIAIIHSITTITVASMHSYADIGINAHSFVSFFKMNSIQAHFWLGIISLSLFQIILCRSINKLSKENQEREKPDFFYLISASVISSFLILIPFRIGLFWGITSLLLLSPFLYLAVYQSYRERIFLFAVFPDTFMLLTNSWSNQYLNSIKIFVFVIVLYILMNTDIAWNYVQGIFLNFKYDESTTYLLEIFVLTLITISLLAIYSYFLISTSIFNYYAFKEIIFAENLKKRIDNFGDRNSLFGFEKEQRR